MISKVIVQYKNGSAVKGARIVFGFSMGMTRDFYTNCDGITFVEHVSSGNCSVYIDGRMVGSFNAPGTFVHTYC